METRLIDILFINFKLTCNRYAVFHATDLERTGAQVLYFIIFISFHHYWVYVSSNLNWSCRISFSFQEERDRKRWTGYLYGLVD